MKLIDLLDKCDVELEVYSEIEDYDIVISGHPGEIGSFFDEDNVTIDDKHKQIRIDI